VLVLAALIRIPPLLTSGQGSDLRDFADWGWTTKDRGLGAAYHERKADYPPVYLYVLGLLARAGEAVGVPGPETGRAALDRWPLSFYLLLKIPGFVADLLLGVAIFLAARRWGRPDRAVAAAATVVLNPALIYATAWWGQVDNLHTLLMVAALAAALAARPGLAGGTWALAVLTKFQGVIVAPALALLILRTGARGVLRAVAVTLAVAVVALIPVIAAGELRAVLGVYVGSTEKWPVVTKSAHNLWYLAVPGKDVSDKLAAVGPLTYRQVGLLLLGGWTALVMALSLRGREPWALWVTAAALALGFFCLPTQMHERYLYPAPVLLAVVAWRDARLLTLFAVLSATLFLNMALLEPADQIKAVATRLGWWVPHVVALLNMAALVALGAWLWLRGPGDGERHPRLATVDEAVGGPRPPVAKPA
jgi:Gpi18-like mannosyltransferase